MLALARVGADEQISKVVSRLKPYPHEGYSRDEQLAVLRCYELLLLRGVSIPTDRTEGIARNFPGIHASVNRSTSSLLVALKSTEVVAQMLQLLAATEDQAEQLYYLDVLSKAEAGWSPEYRETFFRALQRARSFNGDKSFPGFVSRIRKRAVQCLTGERGDGAGTDFFSQSISAESRDFSAAKTAT